jgi:hypothetical protein
MKLIKPLLAGLTAMVVASSLAVSAHATQISGTIGFTSASGSSGGFVTKAGNDITLHFNNPMRVNFNTDDYLGTINSTVDFASVAFDNTTGALISPNIPEWSFTIGATTYSFDLLSASGHFQGGASSALTIMGQGVAHITGFDDTVAMFSLQGTGTGFTFTILQASNTAVPGVPEGGSAVALLGLGLVALEGLRRRLATA